MGADLRTIAAGLTLAALAGLAATVWLLSARLEAATAARDAAVAAAEASARAVDDLTRHAATVERTLREERDANARNLRRLGEARARVEAGEDGPVAPALRRALDGVAAPAAAGGGPAGGVRPDGAGDPGGAPVGARPAARLP
ncbi:MAG: hypothetical protein IM628_02525 [Phenylobacterium sp.]|uniref:hypothetical protein n=1 Tax=Phenylobacterium sp. TaxID=1871053 RepID=UPI0025F1119B|nr:hypothetical protein [Phenylobacterium sp.]MCA6303682.1 hypothetical protein [Phenylobacterium sp.]